MNGLKLTKIIFDHFKNHENVEFEKIFVDIAGGTNAYSYLTMWFEAQPPEKRYIGWNYQIYPKYVVERIVVNE
jgi:hypothetical protein